MTAVHNYTIEFSYEHCFVIHHHEPPSAMVHGASKTTLNIRPINCDMAEITIGDSSKGIWPETKLTGKVSARNVMAILIKDDKTVLLDARLTTDNQLKGTLTFIDIEVDNEKRMASYVKATFIGYPDSDKIQRG